MPIRKQKSENLNRSSITSIQLFPDTMIINFSDFLKGGVTFQVAKSNMPPIMSVPTH